MSIKVLISLGLFALISFACDYRYEKTPPLQEGSPMADRNEGPVSFSMVAEQVLEPKCASCHNASTDFDICNHSIASATKESIMRRISSNGRGQMPPSGAPQLTPEEKSLITEWIQSGTPN